ncbi:unnamed protein product [Thlaspi arvense]|uniref:Uncharacterized protein n=1 Tax=Thlaspi arvense TaxID=13288 RepID=A0AAU9RTL5_THLAR|nr:unnamed protein product [Thlaspi arvense]
MNNQAFCEAPGHCSKFQTKEPTDEQWRVHLWYWWQFWIFLTPLNPVKFMKTTYMNILLGLIEALNKPPHSLSEIELI